ncbi:hypothetical protein J2Z66_006387 [Paenibacillus eucommiae]|uniref:Uncharacterized protein n=2 Tax=Paenibacillus eucommiae TaxID=1355755 RepID=A0ABS4J4I4_9BACL|nr:hypothetical protein [Paenibacillus eucommiae]
MKMDMNLADMLSYTDIFELSRIASTYDCQCNGNSKNELIQSILSTLNRREVFEKHIQDLNVEDIRFLNYLLSDPRNSFSLEELTARVKQSRFQASENNLQNPREIIIKFKRLGWLFNGYSQQTKYVFQVPNDLKGRFADVLTAKFRSTLQVTDDPGVYRDEQMLLIEDVEHFLQWLSEQQEVMLTAENSMYKRSLQQILDRMSVKEEMVAKGAWRFGYGRMYKEYPNRFSLIYDYCFFHHLIVEQQAALQLSDTGKTKLLERSKENPIQVYRFWLRLYKGPIPNLQSIVQWINRLAQTWVTAASVGEVLCKLIKPFYYDSSESIFEQRILQMMMHLGLLRIGENDDYGQVIQMTKLGSKVIEGTYVAEDDKIELPADR